METTDEGNANTNNFISKLLGEMKSQFMGETVNTEEQSRPTCDKVEPKQDVSLSSLNNVKVKTEKSTNDNLRTTKKPDTSDPPPKRSLRIKNSEDNREGLKRSSRRRSKETRETVLQSAIARKEKSFTVANKPIRSTRLLKPTQKILENLAYAKQEKNKSDNQELGARKSRRKLKEAKNNKKKSGDNENSDNEPIEIRKSLRLSASRTKDDCDTECELVDKKLSQSQLVERTMCLCTISTRLFMSDPGNDEVFCCAVDSMDDKLIGCNRLADLDSPLLRPSQRVPYTIMCELHRNRMLRHNCCPTCGIFCTQGIFLECESKHQFHLNCHGIVDGKFNSCPHCGDTKSASRIKMTMQSRGAPIILKSQTSNYMAVKMQRVISSASLNNSKCFDFVLNATRTGRTQELATLLTTSVIDINEKVPNTEGGTLLHYAARIGNRRIARLLIRAGIEIDFMDNNNSTALMVAIISRKNKVASYLIKMEASVHIKDYNGMTPLHLASKTGNLKVVKQILKSPKFVWGLIDMQDRDGWTPLCWTCSDATIDVSGFLLSLGADPNVRDKESNTILHWVAFSGCFAGMDLLLENKRTDINAVNIHNETALHIAARGDCYSCVQLLLDKGANLSLANIRNETPMACAPMLSRSYRLIFEKIQSTCHTIKSEGGGGVIAQAITPLCYGIKKAESCDPSYFNAVEVIEMCDSEDEPEPSPPKQLKLDHGNNKAEKVVVLDNQQISNVHISNYERQIAIQKAIINNMMNIKGSLPSSDSEITTTDSEEEDVTVTTTTYELSTIGSSRNDGLVKVKECQYIIEPEETLHNKNESKVEHKKIKDEPSTTQNEDQNVELDDEIIRACNNISFQSEKSNSVTPEIVSTNHTLESTNQSMQKIEVSVQNDASMQMESKPPIQKMFVGMETIDGESDEEVVFSSARFNKTESSPIVGNEISLTVEPDIQNDIYKLNVEEYKKIMDEYIESGNDCVMSETYDSNFASTNTNVPRITDYGYVNSSSTNSVNSDEMENENTALDESECNFNVRRIVVAPGIFSNGTELEQGPLAGSQENNSPTMIDPVHVGNSDNEINRISVESIFNQGNKSIAEYGIRKTPPEEEAHLEFNDDLIVIDDDDDDDDGSVGPFKDSEPVLDCTFDLRNVKTEPIDEEPVNPACIDQEMDCDSDYDNDQDEFEDLEFLSDDSSSNILNHFPSNFNSTFSRFNHLLSLENKTSPSSSSVVYLSQNNKQISIECLNLVDDEAAPSDFNYITCSKASADYSSLPTCLKSKCCCYAVSCVYTGSLGDGFEHSLQLFKTKSKGWALRTLNHIPAGAYVCEYVGEILTEEDANLREDDSYFFDLGFEGGVSYYIDSKYFGNLSRFINHSCNPNVLPVKVLIDSQAVAVPRIGFFAIHDVLPNEEISFDYGEKFWTTKCKLFTCMCGDKNCKYSTVDKNR